MTSPEVSKRIPRILWAQRQDIIYVTVEIVEAKNEVIDVQSKSFSFSATQGNTNDLFEVSFEFYDEIDPSATTTTKSDRNIFLVLKKADTEKPFWPRLVKSGKPHFVHTDFGRWKDEDEEDEMPPSGMMGGGAGMDFSQLSSMMGGGGFPMGGPDFGEDEEEGGEDSDGNDEEDPYQKKGNSSYSTSDSE